MTVDGTYDPRFESLRELLEQTLDSGEDLGASIALDVDGELLVDIWGGWRDQDRAHPWERDTIVNVWSCTKTVTSLAMLMLASRGQLDLEPFDVRRHIDGRVQRAARDRDVAGAGNGRGMFP